MTATFTGSGADKEECQKRRQQKAGRLGENRQLLAVIGLGSNGDRPRLDGTAIDSVVRIEAAHDHSNVRLRKQRPIK